MAQSTGLNKAQQAQVRSLMKEDRWDAVMRFVALKIDQWRTQKISGNSEFETLRDLFTRDGKVEGVLEVFDQLERQAFEE